MNQKVYIIKPYNKYLHPEKGETIISIFCIYDNWYCISEVELEWGTPRVARTLEEQDNFGYHLYNTLEEAQAYVSLLKRTQYKNI